jgi:carbon monoxide dehydrogenase subunit G
MAEQLVNEFTVNRPIDEAWAVITDVEKIAPCLPGAQLEEIEGDVYRGVVKVKLGSITPSFKGQATFIDRDDPGHRAVLKAEGRDTGGRGNAAAEITAQAESLSPTSTRCVVTTDLHITGRVAQFGRGILGDVSKKLMAQFASNLNTMLDEQGPNGPASTNGEADATAEAGSDTDTSDAGLAAAEPADAASGGAAEAAASAADGPPQTNDLPPAGAEQSGPQPRVRKIEGPDTEPVDLAGVAGPAILKRLAPLLVVILVALIVLRRRR